jgi:hypothetical protein
MPVVPYYQGRPASTWVTAMSGPTRAAAANPADDTSPVSRQPAASVAWRRIPVETSAHAAASASAWEAWASNLLPLGQDGASNNRGHLMAMVMTAAVRAPRAAEG